MQEMVAQLRRGWSRELHDMHVTGIERFDEPADRAALSGGIPAFEHDAERRAKAGVTEQSGSLEAQLEEAVLHNGELYRFGVAAQLRCQVGVVEATHPGGVARQGPEGRGDADGRPGVEPPFSSRLLSIQRRRA